MPGEKVEIRALVPGLETLMSFYDLDDLGQNFHAHGINNAAIAKRLASIINDPDAKTALGGLKEQRERVREAIELNGLISSLSASRTSAAGNRETVTTQRLLSRLSGGNSTAAGILTNGSASVARSYEPEQLPGAVHDPGDESDAPDERDDEYPDEDGPAPEPSEQRVPGT